MNNRRRKYYNYRNNRKKKFYYYCHHNKPFFYHKKYKGLREDNISDQNILLDEDIKRETIEDNNFESVNDVYYDKELELSNDEEDIVLPKLPIIKMALGIVVVVAVVFGVSFAYFNYYQEDPRQADISMGEVYVKVDGNTANISLTKIYPRTDDEARSRTDNYFDFIVKGKNSSPSKVLYYTLNITDGTDVVNKTRISREYIKVDLMQKVNGVFTYVQQGINLDDFDYEGAVPINTTTELQTEFRIRLWMSDEVTISDTDTNATFTQSEFANLYANYHVEINAEDKLIVCKRVTSAANLHTEKCTNADTTAYCRADGYASNGDVTYGNAKAMGTALATGDAFDCNVDGSGYTERFYYVSPYYNTKTQTFNTNTAVLIYYTNTYNTDGVVATSLNGAAYDTSGENWHGPRTAVTHLPSSTQWSNVELKVIKRNLWACNNQNCSNAPVTTTGSGTNQLSSPFSYAGRAARLLTEQELVYGCKGTINNDTSLATDGSLTACNFLFEGTKYTNSSRTVYGPRFETPLSDSSTNVWRAHSAYRSVRSVEADSTLNGVRPVIDVPLSRILY